MHCDTSPAQTFHFDWHRRISSRVAHHFSFFFFALERRQVSAAERRQFYIRCACFGLMMGWCQCDLLAHWDQKTTYVLYASAQTIWTSNRREMNLHSLAMLDSKQDTENKNVGGCDMNFVCRFVYTREPRQARTADQPSRSRNSAFGSIQLRVHDGDKHLANAYLLVFKHSKFSIHYRQPEFSQKPHSTYFAMCAIHTELEEKTRISLSLSRKRKENEIARLVKQVGYNYQVTEAQNEAWNTDFECDKFHIAWAWHVVVSEVSVAELFRCSCSNFRMRRGRQIKNENRRTNLMISLPIAMHTKKKYSKEQNRRQMRTKGIYFADDAVHSATWIDTWNGFPERFSLKWWHFPVQNVRGLV